MVAILYIVNTVCKKRQPNLIILEGKYARCTMELLAIIFSDKSIIDITLVSDKRKKNRSKVKLHVLTSPKFTVENTYISDSLYKSEAIIT